MAENVHSCDDKDLGSMLHRLFTEQPEADEIEIQHPTDGAQVITREKFYATVDELGKARKMNPAQKLMKRKQNERLKVKLQTRFRTALITAKVVKIDINDGKFGYDVDGDKIPVDGFTFVRANEYPKGTPAIDDEVGSFIDESWNKPPIRVIGVNIKQPTQ